MTTVGIREFSYNMSKYLKKIKAGERIVITNRNIPVADIVPLREYKLSPVGKSLLGPVKLKAVN